MSLLGSSQLSFVLRPLSASNEQEPLLAHAKASLSEFDFSDSVEGVYAPPALLSQRLPFSPRPLAQGPEVDNIEQYDCEMLWTCSCLRVYFDPDEGGFYHVESHLDAPHVVVGPLALAPPIAVFATAVEPVRTTATKLTRDDPLLVLSSCVHGICAIQAPAETTSDLVFADLVNAPSPSPRKRKRGSVANSDQHLGDTKPPPIAGPSERPKGKGKGKAVCVAPPAPPVDAPEQKKLPSRASPSSPKDCDPFVCGIDECAEEFPSEVVWEAHMKATHGLFGGNWVKGAACRHDKCKKKNPPTHFAAWNTFVRHHRSAHRERRKSPIVCPECGLVFSRHDPLWRHIETQHEPKSEELYKQLGKRPRTKGTSKAPTKSKSKAQTKSGVATQSSTRTRTRTAAAPVAGPSRARRREESPDENAYGEDEDEEDAPEDSGSEWDERPKKKKKKKSHK